MANFIEFHLIMLQQKLFRPPDCTETKVPGLWESRTSFLEFVSGRDPVISVLFFNPSFFYTFLYINIVAVSICL